MSLACEPHSDTDDIVLYIDDRPQDICIQTCPYSIQVIRLEKYSAMQLDVTQVIRFLHRCCWCHDPSVASTARQRDRRQQQPLPVTRMRTQGSAFPAEAEPQRTRKKVTTNRQCRHRWRQVQRCRLRTTKRLENFTIECLVIMKVIIIWRLKRRPAFVFKFL